MHQSIPRAISYDDVLLQPGYSEILPSQADIQTELCRGIELKIPVLSAAMDTITERDMAIALGDSGGAGVIHRNMSPAQQAAQVEETKQSGPAAQVESAPRGQRIKQAEVVEGATQAHGPSPGRLSGTSSKGSDGLRSASHRIVGAAVAPADFERRLPLLQESGVDFLVIDTAHGDSKSVVDTVRAVKKSCSLPVIAGNVATAGGTRRLIEAGADAVKVGVGPGSICTTRIVAGIGVPQLSAVLQCAEAAKPYGIPIIADGGIRYSGDIVKALAAGASTVMLGNLLSGYQEAPGEVFEQDGQLFKLYRGMGSEGALKAGGADRYQDSSNQTAAPVPEGVEGVVPVKGPVADFIYQLMQGLRKGMGYCGCPTVGDLQDYARFVRLTTAGVRESHVHSLSGMKAAVNYAHTFNH